MTNQKRAAEIYKASKDVADLLDGMVLALDQAEARGRRKGLEEAAKVVYPHACDGCTPLCKELHWYAAAIRALADAREDGK